LVDEQPATPKTMASTAELVANFAFMDFPLSGLKRFRCALARRLQRFLLTFF